jgi:hypothetical protein
MILEFEGGNLAVDHDRIRIGTAEFCDLQLPTGPRLHSTIRSEAGVVWIEADVDCTDLLVNWRTCRRMALRDGDVISAGGEDITVHTVPARTIAQDAATLAENISHLTADELCDRILSEQAEVDEFEANRLHGWKKLMTAMKQAMADDSSDVAALEEKLEAPAQDCERLLGQIREMSDMMESRSQELDVCESDLLAATALLQETQDRVSRQIEDLLDQIATPAPAEMRASA